MNNNTNGGSGTKQEPTSRRAHSSGVGFVAGITVGAILTVCVAAYAASTSITGGTIGTSAAAHSPCVVDDFGLSAVRTRYVATGERYEIASVTITSVAPGCRNLPTRVTAVNHIFPYNAISNGNAAPDDGALLTDLPLLNNVVTWTFGQGPLLNNVSNSNRQVNFVTAVRG